MRMASITEAFPAAPNIDATRKDAIENPQAYEEFKSAVQHVNERRHILGLVGGNEVSRISGNMVDLESDLLGITRPNSDAIYRHHLPATAESIVRNNPKLTLKIETTQVHLKEYQQWAYPSVFAPLPLVKESCSKPEKY